MNSRQNRQKQQTQKEWGGESGERHSEQPNDEIK